MTPCTQVLTCVDYVLSPPENFMIRSFVHFDVRDSAESSKLYENKASEKLDLRIINLEDFARLEYSSQT
jgi:hypothetical protein